MSTIIKPEDVRKGDRIKVTWPERDGVVRTAEFTVASIPGFSITPEGMSWPLYDTADLHDTTIELVDRPKPVIKVGDRVRYTTQYGTVTEFDVHTISEHNYAYPRDPLLPGRRVESLELVTEQ